MENTIVLNIGDLIGVNASPNNHGCRDYAIVRITSVNGNEAEGVVTEAQSCHSCWQVGHGADHVFAVVGEKFLFDISRLEENTEFATSVAWQCGLL